MHNLYSKKAKIKMKTKIQNHKIIVIIALAILLTGLVTISAIQHSSARAASTSDLRKKADRLQKEIEANQSQADKLGDKADSLKDAIGGLDIQIRSAVKQIELTKVKIAQLEDELVKTQAELDRQKGMLKASMRALYKRGGASTTELLVGSDSFSQFIDEQEYLERLKLGIQDSAQKVIDIKLKIQGQKDDQEKLKKQQEANKQDLDNSRTRRAELLRKTQGEESKYKKVVADLEKQQAAAEAALARALNSGSYRVSPVGAIARGGIVGAVGSTGLSSGPHLHLEVRNANGVTNPKPYIKAQPINMPPGYVSQGYGNPDPIYARGFHPGMDFAISSGSPIFAIDNGYMYRGCSNQMLGTSNNAYGYVAIVEHSNGTKSVYAHMSGGPSACNFNTYY